MKISELYPVSGDQLDHNFSDSTLQIKPKYFNGTTKITKIGNTSLTFDISIYSNRKNILLARGNIIQVYTDQIKKCSTPLSKSFVKKIRKFENYTL